MNLSRAQRRAPRSRYRSIGFTLTSQEALDSVDQQLGAFVAALSLAIANCPGLSDVDKTAWAGVAASYATIHADIVATEALNSIVFATFKLTRYGILIDQLEALRPQLDAFRTKVAAACGNAPPAPAPQAPPGGAPSPWPSAVKWVAAAVVVAGVAYVASPAVRVWAGSRAMMRPA